MSRHHASLSYTQNIPVSRSHAVRERNNANLIDSIDNEMSENGFLD